MARARLELRESELYENRIQGIVKMLIFLDLELEELDMILTRALVKKTISSLQTEGRI